MKWGLTTTPGTICPDLCDKCVGSFTSHRVVWTVKGCETGSTVYSPYPKRLESLTICGCNYKGGAFSSVILRPWVLVWPESNSRPPAWQPDAQPTEPPVRGAKLFTLTRTGAQRIEQKKKTAEAISVCIQWNTTLGHIVITFTFLRRNAHCTHFLIRKPR